jgi:hypothetical protein
LVVLLIGAFVLTGAIFGSIGDEAGVAVQESFVRIRGFFGNPNTQGLMAMLIFFPLVWWQRTARHGTGRTVLGLLVLLWGALVVLSGSRASFVGLIAGGAALIWIYGRASLRYAPVMIAGLILLVAFVVTDPQFGRVLEVATQPMDPVTGTVVPGVVRNVDRPYLIQRAFELGMRGRPDKVFLDDRPYLLSQGVYIGGSHNSYMRMFVDLGLAGVVAGLAIFALVLAPVFLNRSFARRDVTLALLAATAVAGLTNAFFEDWLFGFGNASTYPMWFFFALIPIRLAQLQAEDAGNAAQTPAAVPGEGGGQ